MKTIDIDQLRAHLDDYLAEAVREDVVVTHDGKPWVVLRAALVGEDETADLAGSPEFWDMIQQRRTEPSISWEEAKTQLDLD